MIQMAERHDNEGFRRRRRHQQRAEGRDEVESHLPPLPSAAIDSIQMPVFRTTVIDPIQLPAFRTVPIQTNFVNIFSYKLILSFFFLI